MDDEIDNLNRRVDDAQPIGFFLQCRSKEILVKFHQYPLTCLAVVQTTGTHPYALIEALKIPRFVLQAEFPKNVLQLIEGFGNGIGFSEIVMLEKCLEYGAGEVMLGHHVNSIVVGDRIVDGLPQFALESIEPFAKGIVTGVMEKLFDPRYQAGEDIGHILGPGFPVFPVAAFLHDSWQR